MTDIVNRLFTATPPEPVLWVLTYRVNDYDQHGEYFQAAWPNEVTAGQLQEAGVPAALVEHVLRGGGRVSNEYDWWYLTAVQPGGRLPENRE